MYVSLSIGLKIDIWVVQAFFKKNLDLKVEFIYTTTLLAISVATKHSTIIENNKKRKKKTDRSVIHSILTYPQRHRPDIYMYSLQSPFLDVKCFCIKLCRLFSATCFTDCQLNNCIHCAIVSRDIRQNILLIQLPTAKSGELMWALFGGQTSFA